ncbi:MAG: MoxR family ATPase [Thermoplasmata archaeon]|nr:MoxR family ATPase [Thermoplasmata archaeon]
MKGPDARIRMQAVQAAVHQAVVGRDDAIDLISTGLLADGHILLEDLPGLGKTLIAKSFAAALGLSFSRVQFTADLMPQDITGAEMLDATGRDLKFRPGPLFANIVLADEINRAPPKVQSALLEAMQEFQVTSDRSSHALERPFLVLATQNPLELEGTYPLPEAQVDRFLMRIAVGYPTVEEEGMILQRRGERKEDDARVPPVLAPGEFKEMQRSVEEIEIEATIQRYAIEVVRATRGDARVEVGASPRGSLALLKLSRARALLQGRDYVVPDDVKQIALPALAHRVLVKPEPYLRGIRGEQVVKAALERVPVPKVG